MYMLRTLREHGTTIIFSDSYSGTKMDRPAFSLLMNKLQAGDAIVVTKLDRIARTANEGFDTIHVSSRI